jgi:thioredoxin
MELSATQFKESVYDYESGEILSQKPVMVEFYTQWCGACKTIGPYLDTFAQKFENQIDVVKVDITKSDALAFALGIRSVPTFLFLKPSTKSRDIVVNISTPLLVEKAIAKYLL